LGRETEEKNQTNNTPTPPGARGCGRKKTRTYMGQMAGGSLGAGAWEKGQKPAQKAEGG